MPLFLTLTHTHTNTYTHTISLSHTHTHAHTHTLSHTLALDFSPDGAVIAIGLESGQVMMLGNSRVFIQ